MAGERSVCQFRSDPQGVEKELTGELGYDSQSVPAKGAENYLSLQIHLGEMERATKGISPESAAELRKLTLWRNDINRTGVEDNLRLNTLRRLTEALDKYRAAPKPEAPKPIIIKPQPAVVEDARKYRRLKGAVVNTGRITASAAATIALGASAFFLGKGLAREREPLIDQISLTAEQYIELTKQLEDTKNSVETVAIQGQLDQVHSHRDKVWDKLDDIGNSPEQFGLYGSLLGVLCVGGVTIFFITSPKHYNSPETTT